MRVHQRSRPQLGRVVIAGGVKMKLLAIWFCGNRSMAEDLLAHLSICWRWTPGSPRDCLPAAMDNRVGWKKRAMGGGEGAGGIGGSTEVDLVVVQVVVFQVESCPMTSKLLLQWWPSRQAPGLTGSALGLVGPV